MNVRPLRDRILLERVEEQEQRFGGIIIPDTAKEKPQQGRGRRRRQRPRQRQGRRVPARRQGRATPCSSASTPAREIKIDGKEYLILREEEVLGVVEGVPEPRARVGGELGRLVACSL